MLRGAIVGLGNVALEGHLPGWRAATDARIVAVTDVDGGRRREAAAHVPEARWFDSSARLLDDPDLDFVDICTPPSSHAPLIERALAGGLHVLCEKPLVRSLDELARVRALAVARDRVVHTVHNWHHAPIVRRTTELVRAGVIGRVTAVRWRTLRTRPAAARAVNGDNWRLDPTVAGGGILTDHGWHVFYVLSSWIGVPPLTIEARLERRRHASLAVEDTASIELAFPGATAEIVLTWAAEERRNWAELTGERGTLELQDDVLVLTQGGRRERWSCPPAMSSGSTHADWFAPVAEAFVREVNGARDSTNLAEASLCVTLESLARESSRRGQPLPVLPITAPSESSV